MKKLFKNKYRTQTTRLKGWDYSSDGIYFITICTQNREHYFGEIITGKMQLTPIGEIAQKYWAEIPRHYPMAILDEFVVMPNHIHGIIILETNNATSKTNNEMPEQSVEAHDNASQIHHPKIKTPGNEVQNFAPHKNTQTISGNETHNNASLRTGHYVNKFGPQSKNIPAIIRGYKSAVKKYATINKIDFVWQARYYDRIIRSDKQFDIVRGYIENNPEKWGRDRNNENNLLM